MTRTRLRRRTAVDEGGDDVGFAFYVTGPGVRIHLAPAGPSTAEYEETNMADQHEKAEKGPEVDGPSTPFAVHPEPASDPPDEEKAELKEPKGDSVQKS